VFLQDFTTMATLSVNPSTMGTGTWIAHTPSSQDWFTFIDPVDNFDPFGIGDGQLTIRVAKRGYGDPNNWFAGYSGGLLSSMDGAGNGFAQQFGFFEASMWCPGGPNTWPAFWLLDRPSLITSGTAGAEIDIVEEYGNWGTPPNDLQPDNYTTTWHRWANGNGSDEAQGSSVSEPGLTAGYHRFGVDIEPDTIVWYYDRTEVWSASTYDEAKRPMFVLLNLALGGGTYNNATATGYDWNLTPNPSDLRVDYVAVWASPNSPNY
jgi:beta-glucanase (GH16 family)